MERRRPSIKGIDLKKKYGQHFLHDQCVVDTILMQVNFDENSSVFEIGCGDGFLTKSILKQKFARFWVFEIDSEWADFVKNKYHDERMKIFEADILQVDFSVFNEFKPWILLSNLPYQITFPILYKLTENYSQLKEAVIMVQEEVAEKIMKTSGRGYGFTSLYLQYFFEWKMLIKIGPNSFYPPPKINSRLLYFKPKQELLHISNETEFWNFIKRCFSHPRRNLKNNLKTFHYDLTLLSEETLNLRAQQINMIGFLEIWNKLLPE